MGIAITYLITLLVILALYGVYQDMFVRRPYQWLMDHYLEPVDTNFGKICAYGNYKSTV